MWVNDKQVGEHTGGYDPFTFDITDAAARTETTKWSCGRSDPTDTGTQPHGKQVLQPHGIFYTAVTGIWQTVWLEPVPADAYRVAQDRAGYRSQCGNRDRSSTLRRHCSRSSSRLSRDAADERTTLVPIVAAAKTGQAMRFHSRFRSEPNSTVVSRNPQFCTTCTSSCAIGTKLVDSVEQLRAACARSRSRKTPMASTGCGSTTKCCSNTGRSIKAGGPMVCTRRRPMKRSSTISK